MTTADYCFESFCCDLATYACSWIVRCQNAIVVHARELYADETMRGMVRTYAELKTKKEDSARYQFVKACLGEDIQEVDDMQTVDGARFDAYKQVLDDLIFDRYCR